MSENRAVLLDRDGTIIVERNYLSDPDGVELIEGAGEGLRRLATAGLKLVLITNQSGVGRGYFDLKRVDELHRRLGKCLAREDVRLDGIYVCPHHPDDGCDCRKPATGLARRAAREIGFDPRRSFVVGDLHSDVELGRNLGAETVLVRTGHGRRTEGLATVSPDHVVDDLRGAAALIERLLRVAP